MIIIDLWPKEIVKPTCFRLVNGLIGLLLLSGCLAPITLNKTVIAYNRSINEINAKEQLLNIARVRHHHPIQFTNVSSIAATFNFQMNAGATPPLGALNSGTGLSPIFGGSVSENPTITITPLNGEEFNQRLINPFSEENFLKLFQNDTDLGLLVRMMVGEIRIKKDGIDQVLRNRPTEKKGYKEFRRRVMHLVSLNQAHHLQLAPIVLEQSITLPIKNADYSETIVNALEMGYRWEEESDAGILSRKIFGRFVFSNYDISNLSLEEKNELFLNTNTLLENEIYIDIRPGFPGGDYPMQGVMRLRSFIAILGFIGRGISDEVEFQVDKDSRSGELGFDPVRTLEIDTAPNNSEKSKFTVTYEGQTYSILDLDTPETNWNLEAFQLLNQLYELSVHPSEFFKPAPAITIAK